MVDGEAGRAKTRSAGTVAVGIVSVAVFAAWMRLGWGGSRATDTVDDIGSLVFSAVAALCCAAAARRCVGRQRLSWTAFAAGLAAWTAGDIAWSVYDLVLGRNDPFPSLADIGYLLFPVGAAIGLLLLRPPQHDRVRLRLLLDGVVAGGSLLVISWVTALGAIYHTGNEGHLAFAVSVAYPLSDLVLLTVTVLTLAGTEPGHRLTLGLIGAAMTMLAVADSAFVYLSATNHYQLASLSDAGWPAGFALIAFAALSAKPNDSTIDDAGEIDEQWLWLPYVPLTAVLAVGGWQMLPQLSHHLVVAVGAVLVGVTVVRQFLLVKDNHQLLTVVAHQAFHDPLTGLANRALFADRLERAVKRQQRNHQPVTLICLDLNDFKLVNDSYGHHTGDELLQLVGQRLHSCIHDGDTLARLGGDEFAILLDNNAGTSFDVAKRIQLSTRRPFRIAGRDVTIEVSIGWATSAGDAATADALLHQADIAMYTAKRTNRMVAYEPGMEILINDSPARHHAHAS